MEPLQVISPDQPAQLNPWPSILRLIALVALLFAAAHILLDLSPLVGSISRPSISPPPTTSRVRVSSSLRTVQRLRVPLAAIDALDCALMIAGALLMLQFPQIRFPLLLACWAWLAIWAAGVAVNLFSLGWRGIQFLGLNVMWIGFPVLAILLLRQHRATNPAAAP